MVESERNAIQGCAQIGRFLMHTLPVDIDTNRRTIKDVMRRIISNLERHEIHIKRTRIVNVISCR